MPRRYMAMHDHLVEGHRTNTEPWARLHREGHGAIWAKLAAFAEANRETIEGALLA